MDENEGGGARNLSLIRRGEELIPACEDYI